MLPPKRSAAQSVVFSESQGEEIIDDDLLSVRDLSDAEFKVVLSKFIKMCDICNTVKPPRTHHCSQCKRCVIRMDHHCVWIANCVGLHNMKPFLLFLIYCVITSIFSFSICCVEFFRCEVFDSDNSCKANSPSNLTIKGLTISNTILCAFGLFFTLIMGFLSVAVLYTQLSRIKEDLTLVDRMQIRERLKHF